MMENLRGRVEGTSDDDSLALGDIVSVSGDNSAEGRGECGSCRVSPFKAGDEGRDKPIGIGETALVIILGASKDTKPAQALDFSETGSK
jgi:hypothetical protein